MRHGAPFVMKDAETRDRTGDLQIFSLTLSQLSYRGGHSISACQLIVKNTINTAGERDHQQGNKGRGQIFINVLSFRAGSLGGPCDAVAGRLDLVDFRV